MADLLVLHQNKQALSKGDIVEVRANGAGMSETEKQDFVLVKVPSLVMSELDQYHKKWELDIDYEVLIHQVSTDGYRIRVYGTAISTTEHGVNYGKISVDKIENYLAKWNAVINNFSDNEVIIDVGTYEVATSRNFWERDDISGVVFNHVSYDSATGLHIISADYSAYGWGTTSVERKIQAQDVTILSHENKVITFSLQGTGSQKQHQNNVSLMKFKHDVTQKVKQTLKRARYHFLDALIDQAVSSNYEIILTEPELLNSIKDKLLE